MTALFRGLATSLLWLTATFALAGCALKDVPLPPDDDPALIQTSWNRFQEKFGGSCPETDFLARGSVNFSSTGRSSRLLFSFWGNTHFPIRMDLQAGIGAMLALWREDQTGWLGYHPGQEKAYQAVDSRSGARLLGLTMPLRLDALAQVLTGCWGELVSSEHAFAHTEPEGFVYHVHALRSSAELLLSPDGIPVTLRESGAHGWSMTIGEWMAEQPRSPKRLRLRQAGGHADVRVQRLKTADALWHPDDLALKPPPGTPVTTLKPDS